MSIGSSRGLAGDSNQQILRLIGYLMLAIFLMSWDHRANHLDRFHAVVSELAQPLYLLIDLPIDGLIRVSQWAEQTDALLEDNQRLAEQLRQQQTDLLRLEFLEEENRALRALLDLSQSRRLNATTARVRRIDLNPFSHRLVIDRGRLDGVQMGQPVLDRAGLIGQIDRVSATSSTMILITDPDHALPVRIARTGLVTLAYGGGLNADLSLPDLPMNVDVEPGDQLITSGLGGVFPAGLPVATITAIDRPAGENFARAQAVPEGAYDRARFVLVLSDTVETVDGTNDGTNAPAVDKMTEPVPAPAPANTQDADPAISDPARIEADALNPQGGPNG